MSDTTPSAPLVRSAPPRPWYVQLAPLPWWGEWRTSLLGPDLVAGITLAAYLVPVSIAYAALAGLPPQAGLYTSMCGCLGFALFGSAKRLAIGPTSAMSLLFGLSIARIAGGDPVRMLFFAGVTTLCVGAMFFLAWLLRLSFIVNFISDSILAGFKTGAGLLIASTQLPKLFGVPGGGDDFFQRLWFIGTQLGGSNLAALGVGLAAILLLLAGERFLPGRPVALGVVLLALAAVPLLGLAETGMAVVGDFPGGLPAPAPIAALLPMLDARAFADVVRLAFACFLLSFIESASAARTLAEEEDTRMDARQLLLGLAASNLASGLFRGFAAAGGLSQSMVNAKAGARSPLSLLVCAAAIALVLLYATSLFRTLPQAILGAIVLVAVGGLIKVREIRQLRRANALDFRAALVAMVGVLLLGILDGVVLAVLTSLLMLLWNSATPRVSELGRIPGLPHFSDIARHPENQRIPGVLAFRVEAMMVYYNVDHIAAELIDLLSEREGIRLVICDLSNTPYVDIAGARRLLKLHEQLDARGVRFRIAEARSQARDILRIEGMEQHIGHISRRVSLEEIVDGFLAENASA